MDREKGELVHDNFLYFSPTEDSQEKHWDVIKETLASTKKPALNAELDNNVNASRNPSSFEPATSNKKGLRSVKTGHKMAVIWTVSLHLASSFSLPTVMSVSNSGFSTNCTATNNCKGYQIITADQRSRLKSTGLEDYFKWFPEPSMASISNLRRIRESSRTSLNKITDLGLLWFRSGFHYFKPIGDCFMIEFYESVNSIFCMDLPSSMMRVAAKIPRFCKRFDSERVTNGYQRNERAENHGINVGEFEKPVSGAPSNWLGHESFLGMLIYPREDSMNTCSIMETQAAFEHDFYNEHLSTPAAIEPNDDIEPNSYTHLKTPFNSGWLIWASLFIVASLVFIRALIRPKKLLSETCKTKLNKPRGNQITIWKKRQKSIARYFGEINQTSIQSTECPRFGSFIEYVEIPVCSQGSPSKELKATPVRRSMRIRNKSLSPLQPAPTFTSPLR